MTRKRNKERGFSLGLLLNSGQFCGRVGTPVNGPTAENLAELKQVLNETDNGERAHPDDDDDDERG